MRLLGPAFLARFRGRTEMIDYCESHKEACKTSTELARSIGGLVVAYIGLRRIILDPLRYDEKATPEMSQAVLYLATQILKDIPAQEKAGAA